MSRTLLVKNIRHLVTTDEHNTVLENVNLFAKDGVIVSIGAEAPEADEVIDAGGMAAYPGLINAHHHLYQYFTRNLPFTAGLELFPWLKKLYQVWKGLDDQTVYWSSAAAMAELVKNGCTTVFDHHYVFPRESGDLVDAQFRAASDLGVRMHVSRGSMSLSEKDGGLPPDSVVQTEDEILADCERVVRKYHDPSRYSMRQIALAPCSPFSVTSELLRDSAILARRLGVRLHTHLTETKDEERFVLEAHGMRPLAYMESLGWVGPDVWYAHGIWFNDEELQLLADTRTGVCHCPASNMILSSGVARIPEMLRLGVHVGLGVDGSASNDGSSMLEEVRTAYLLHRLNSGDAAPSPAEVLRMATAGSASLLGRDDLGILAEGMAADLFLVREDRPELVGAMVDPASTPARVGIRGGVDMTIVNGRVVVRDGRLADFDEERLSHEANAQVARLLERYERGSH